ncbi:hypothetical protein TVAG_287310 [Trichomonas vaginalis G3]|uniref:Uncharacterized protein n=1 Tax=Trichomonas vaginalis (strain ATCC PRA-98 / G3) TaxID=412133 RepID=A2GII4_TRIV3|nr:hypothetical protein TVAG_287310 [Trichomonas vaginalis G3]|eukprot:XP_001295962.1 hypothetical protein [Trichomonas vaginalis G3]
MHEADLRENERILSKVTDEQAAEFLEKIEQVREEYIHKAEQALPQGENLDMLRDFSEIPERRYRRQEGEIDSDDDEVSIHIKGTEALRASLPIICEFDTLQNR